MRRFAEIFRAAVADRRFAALNTVGLALGVAVFLLLAFYVRYERGINAFPGSDQLWTVQERHLGPGRSGALSTRTTGRELDLLRADNPGLHGARYSGAGGSVRVAGRLRYDNVVLVDPGFFSFFAWPSIAGDPVHALASPDAVVLTRSAARTYFGDADPLGRTLPITVGGVERPYRVAAIVADTRPQLMFSGSLFLRLDRSSVGAEDYDRWDRPIMWTFLRFRSSAEADAFAATRLPAFLARWVFPTRIFRPETYRQSLVPLGDVSVTPADRVMLAALMAVGVLTLLVAVFNSVNLATARAARRAREVAVRKVVGATRRTLIVQFVGEATLIAAAAVLLGLALAEALLPQINALGGTDIAIPYGAGLLATLVMLVVGIGLLGGLYPAIMLSRYAPHEVLATMGPANGGRRGQRLRRGLVIAQFGVAVAFAIVTTVMVAQITHLRRADPGFARDGLLTAAATSYGAMAPAQSAALLTAFRTLPFVREATVNDIAPTWGIANRTASLARPDDPARRVDTTLMPVGPGYFEAYRSHRLAGRLFDAKHGLDNAGGAEAAGVNVVLNVTATRALGFATPSAAIGQVIGGDAMRGVRVIGVVADMRFGSPRDPVPPMVYVRDAAASGGTFTLRVDAVDRRDATAAIETAWKRTAPDVPFQVMSVDGMMAELVAEDRQRARLVSLGTVLAVAIGCIGLYGLAAADTSRRMREIGIRKTLGATRGQVMRLLLAGFMRPVLLANFLGWPLAFVAARHWLAGFDERIALTPLMFIGPSVAGAVIAMLTVTGQSWRSARAEPVRALREG